MGYVSVQIEIDSSDIVDALNEYEYIELWQDMKKSKFKDSINQDMTPMQIIYALRHYNIDLLKLRDKISEIFPEKKRES